MFLFLFFRLEKRNSDFERGRAESGGEKCRTYDKPTLFGKRGSSMWPASDAILLARAFVARGTSSRFTSVLRSSLRSSGRRRPSRACSPPTKANRVTPGFRMWESCWTMPLVGGFSRGSPFSPALEFRRYSVLTSITLIGTQDLSTHSTPLHAGTRRSNLGRG
ncbi:hypothetical protein PR048_025661 [Dryococelus australis]|uniref:Uncharacterized protein n=1 Tax=Dryococelus australis TaxID=614101 RepID=A0ABQ9GJ64_9NEOP|nr:hypothetical protein PR048_025661 [Dryococelus australis]